MGTIRRVLIVLVLAAAGSARAEPRVPFGSHAQRYAEGTIHPSRPQDEMDADVVRYYRRWKAAHLVSFSGHPGWKAIRSLDASHPYVAEAQGYGLEILALLAGADPAAKENFDAILRFVLAHPSTIDPGLMAAEQDREGASVNGGDSATDGDLSIAYALLLADRQWGSAGEYDYRRLALRRLAAIKRGEIDPKTRLPLLGDWAREGDEYRHTARPSDFIIDHFRAFYRITGDGFWKGVIVATQGLIERLQTRYAPETGLLPDFVVGTGASDPRPAPGDHLERGTDGDYSFNVTRAPWRLGTDAAVYGDETSRREARRMTRWIRQATGDDPERIMSGYSLDGRPLDRRPDIIFIATFAPAAMFDRSDQAWLDALWREMLADAHDAELDGYYGSSLLLQTMIVVSGNYWTPAAR